MSLFFLSHASADADDRYFTKFLTDFRRELSGLTGEPDGPDLGFRDADSIPLGAEWERRLEQELLRCRTFIAMLSPWYLRRPWCQKEWAAFEWRLRTQGGATPPDLLLPLRWLPIPDGDLPPAISKLQSAHAAFGDTYLRHGLLVVVRNDGHEYHEFLRAFAVRVRDLVRQHELPSPLRLPAPHALPDLFAIAKPATAAIRATTHAPMSGPKHVEFIVVAGTQSELERDRARECLASYGATLHEWCPYQRGDDNRVAFLVQRIAQKKKLTSGIHPATQDLVARISDALGRNVPVVLVVDIWTLRLATYRSYMELFDDAHRLVNAGVLVVWDLDDNERKHHEHDLDTVLRRAFPKLTTILDSRAFHHRLDTQKDLIRRLHATLATLRTRITVFGEVKRRAEGDRQIPKPVLEQRGDPGPHDALLHPLTNAEPGAT